MVTEYELKDWAMDLLCVDNLPDDGLINGKLVRKIWSEHLSGRRNWDFRLWPVLMWQQWLKSKKLL